MAYVTRVRREPISVDELIRRVQAENAARQSEMERVERLAHTAPAAGRARRQGNPMRWLVAASGGMAALSVFAVVSLAFGDGATDTSVRPEGSVLSAGSVPQEPATFTGSRPVPVQADPRPVATVTIVRKMSAPVAAPVPIITSPSTVSGSPQIPPYWYYGPYGAYWGPPPAGASH
jgi:hypothetical protein